MKWRKTLERFRRNILIIANPISGRGKTLARVAELEGLLRSRNHVVETHVTRKPGDARQRAEDIASSFHCVVVAGGDGTVNEVVNGLREPFRVPLVHMGTGTANQLANHLGIPRAPRAMALFLEKGRESRIDLGLLNGYRFILQTSAGFEAHVTQIFAERPRLGMGYLEYFGPVLRSLVKHRLQDVEVRIDNGPPSIVRGIIVTKVRQYGGLFLFCPKASLCSGRFEICLFREKRRSAHILSYLAALCRMSSVIPWMSTESGKRVLIQSERPLAIQVDGTYIGTTPAEVRLIPSALPVLIPD